MTIVDAENIGPLFGQGISLDRHTLPAVDPTKQVADFQAVPLLRTGWYDWFVNDALETWELLRAHAPEPLRSQARIIITPSSHNTTGYKEQMGDHPELWHNHWTNVDFTLHWYQTVRDEAIDDWPRVIYYLDGCQRVAQRRRLAAARGRGHTLLSRRRRDVEHRGPAGAAGRGPVRL